MQMTANPSMPTVLQPSRLKMAGVLVVSAIFVAIGISMIRSTDTVLGMPSVYAGWFTVVVFTLGLAISVASLLPGANYLRLEPGGYTTCALFRRTFTPWTAVRGFGVTQVILRKMVGINFEPEVAAPMRGARINTKLVGFDGALPDTYGMSAVALADLMNRELSKARLRTG
jgi:hypothetical protein